MVALKRWLQNYGTQVADSFAHFDLLLLTKRAYNALTPIELKIGYMCTGMFVLFGYAFLLNHFLIHYKQVLPLLSVVPGSLLGFLLFFIWISANRARYIKTCSIFLAVFYTFLAAYATSLLALGAMLTPSPWLLSHQLNQVDIWLHFHQVAWMQWASHYRFLEHVLAWSYTAWSGEIILAAPLLAIFGQLQRAFNYIFLALVVGTICCLIYMIWPSLPPAADFAHIHFFEASSYALIHRYYAIHHHHLYIIGNSGLIAFPSYHVAMALLVVWATRHLKWFWIVMIIFNLFVIASTLLLGYHYLIDVIASGMIVAISLLLS